MNPLGCPPLHTSRRARWKSGPSATTSRVVSRRSSSSISPTHVASGHPSPDALVIAERTTVPSCLVCRDNFDVLPSTTSHQQVGCGRTTEGKLCQQDRDCATDCAIRRAQGGQQCRYRDGKDHVELQRNLDVSACSLQSRPHRID